MQAPPHTAKAYLTSGPCSPHPWSTLSLSLPGHRPRMLKSSLTYHMRLSPLTSVSGVCFFSSKSCDTSHARGLQQCIWRNHMISRVGPANFYLSQWRMFADRTVCCCPQHCLLWMPSQTHLPTGTLAVQAVTCECMTLQTCPGYATLSDWITLESTQTGDAPTDMMLSVQT